MVGPPDSYFKCQLSRNVGGLKPVRVAFAPLLQDENEYDDTDPSPTDEDSSHKRKDPPE